MDERLLDLLFDFDLLFDREVRFNSFFSKDFDLERDLLFFERFDERLLERLLLFTGEPDLLLERLRELDFLVELITFSGDLLRDFDCLTGDAGELDLERLAECFEFSLLFDSTDGERMFTGEPVSFNESI